LISLFFQVMAWAKHTGDIAVLSRTDLGVIALTYAAEVETNGFANIREVPGKASLQSEPWREYPITSRFQAPVGAEAAVAQPQVVPAPVTVPKAPAVNPWNKTAAPAPIEPKADEVTQEDAFPALHSSAPKKEVDVTAKMNSLSIGTTADAPSQSEQAEDSTASSTPLETHRRTQVYAEDEPSDVASDTDDSDAGEWITPENVVTHKSQDLGLAPSGYSAEGVFQPAPTKVRKDRGRKGKGKALAATLGRALDVACMTGDYAVQNVIMQIGLNLVGTGGKKMAQVKSWVLRCHACFR
jgi:RNA-binding protein NOB1